MCQRVKMIFPEVGEECMGRFGVHLNVGLS